MKNRKKKYKKLTRYLFDKNNIEHYNNQNRKKNNYYYLN